MCADRWRKSDDDGPACGTGDVVPPPAPAQKIERWPSERTSTHAGRHVPGPSLSAIRRKSVAGASRSLWSTSRIDGRRRCGAGPSSDLSALSRPSRSADEPYCRRRCPGGDDAAAAIRIIGTCCEGSLRRGCGDDGLEFENMVEIARCL